MKRHSSMPCSKDFQRVVDVVREIIEKHVPHSTAYYKTDKQGKVKIFKLFGESFDVKLGNLPTNEEVRCTEPKDIHQAIPAHLKWPQLE